jgi:hypothetical protein
MHIRCKSCHEAVWLRCEGEPDSCACGVVYRFKRPFSDARRKKLGQRARELAKQYDVDLPAAYSISMGILTIEQVRDVQRPPDPPPAPEPTAETTEEPTSVTDAPGRTYKFDRGFDDAVADGCLSPQQAFERGSREALATRIAERHRLQKRLAYAVADNRMPLLAALREQSSATQPAVVPVFEPPGPSGAWAKRLLVGATLALAGIGVWAWMMTRGTGEPGYDDIPTVGPARSEPAPGGEEASRAKALRASTRVSQDGQGRVTRVEGPDPRSVAIAFCEAFGGERAFEVFDVVPSVPPDSRSRLGVIRDLERRSFHTIAIRKDGESGRWLAGNGQAPVRPGVAPEAALNAVLTH